MRRWFLPLLGLLNFVAFLPLGLHLHALGGLLGAFLLGVLGHYAETNVGFFGKPCHIDLMGVPHAITDGSEHGGAEFPPIMSY